MSWGKLHTTLDVGGLDLIFNVTGGTLSINMLCI